MTKIPNTFRRGKIFWFRVSRRLPSGNLFRPTVSLRTDNCAEARRRAARLTARFEEMYMRLFGSATRRLAMDAPDATKIFKAEFEHALDQIEDEREHASLEGYEYGSFETFLDVHEHVYRYLAETKCSGEAPTMDDLLVRYPALAPRTTALVHGELQRLGAIWHTQLDEAAGAMEAQGLDTDIFHLDHAIRLRFEARLAALREYREGMIDPARRFAGGAGLSKPIVQPVPQPTPPVVPTEPPAADIPLSPLAGMSATEFGRYFVEENPKLNDHGSRKRGARWTEKTRSQFEAAMRMLEKSMGAKSFIELSNNDLKQLLDHFDRLPHTHHKTPRHQDMSLEEICQEAASEVAAGKRDKGSIGLNVPTLNRHFRFIRMAHDWAVQRAPSLTNLDWAAYSFDDHRSARDVRDPFPVQLGRKILRLPPWRGCAGRSKRFVPGRELFHDAAYWVFLILWYTGMRREEACKLKTSDLSRHENGVWYFDVNDTDTGRVKNNSSRRWIPMADELIRLGLPQFSIAKKNAEGDVLLFPELKAPSRMLGDTYYRLCWNKIVAHLNEDFSGVTLHGIRHMVADELKDAGVSTEFRADLLGHTVPGETEGRYSKAARLKAMQPIVNQIPVISSTLQPIPHNSQPIRD
ncbi:tyrosine-type recombinase/integrase [Sphingomicrobium aestuariivivum]|uniref:tyrosine-type recombinase/integrase n=1 Tax=Sphingomicrobium aestuariivivum TaxID=1582356 RepID=UPI001FD65A43|nr:tyrosine-type recombinase/integrase [Sphingomicrobium aestuariivivum]MCJ8191952.1 tyrosine-type recombinase/integrase [Sphingomicrobium aestuariivivum]